MSDGPVYRIYGKPGLKKSVLIAGWAEDAGHLGMQTLDYIMQDSGSREFGEIRPEDFLPWPASMWKTMWPFSRRANFM